VGHANDSKTQIKKNCKGSVIRFEFSTTSRIIFGEGSLQDIGPVAAGMGRRVLAVTGKSNPQVSTLLETLDAHGIEHRRFIIQGEPDVQAISVGKAFARLEGCDLVIGFGGGSALDAAKAIAILLTNEGDVYDYLEVIGKGRSFARPALPLITVPTTAGSGAEVTRNAVIGSPEHRVKVSLRSLHMQPRVAIVDPEMTYGLPPAITASTGMDALTQLIEPFLSNKATPLTDAVCREGMVYAARSLRRVYTHGSDVQARRGMSLASLCGGLALANAKLGAVHGFAGVLGGMLAAPHGAICARLLPPVMGINLQAIREREGENPVLARFGEVARILTGDPNAVAEDGVAWIHLLAEGLHIPALSAYGLQPDDFPDVIEKSAVSSSMQGNPVRLTEAEMRDILEKAL
jgi:alcohol dehydrogenase class IV